MDGMTRSLMLVRSLEIQWMKFVLFLLRVEFLAPTQEPDNTRFDLGRVIVLMPCTKELSDREHHDKSQADFLSFNRGLMAGSQSAPILTEKKLESSERVKELRPSSTKKFHTYVLPTPGDTHSASLSGPINPDRQSQPTQLWHTSPLHPSMFTKDSRENETPPHTRTPKEQSVLRESNINSWPTILSQFS
ncbi:uncharacterized protein At2g33490-like isoform X1 [Ananas comosus]|uniref:Uncharacterized protein At2g33490-like isoform X1 n=2 Tax=Ananas comosus TaxID=4615 RepID=A0A6P5EC88_ANACO|nr:uncharacterized protein At2g33490-like isoform X1 [Ananas comosus]XP_020080780.1 uncharacterized protein At2g33490-like isoform X1 [Ananas comosus]XP_020080785.1 uncharacterized protein At2g33490-like isoform X1 [Ananas comosus]XP_020080792.1 uncharacterized protein At2g33490-like isoform X1 [Ananas comosus]XP_020080799.1 uncharacterized protein At2g33490-like isoform X1 [Ananas comosus]XP_020080801.1 uncharacterized protein At2g33490-like isoform X1 [Ananas comosus]